MPASASTIGRRSAGAARTATAESAFSGSWRAFRAVRARLSRAPGRLETVRSVSALRQRFEHGAVGQHEAVSRGVRPSCCGRHSQPQQRPYAQDANDEHGQRQRAGTRRRPRGAVERQAEGEARNAERPQRERGRCAGARRRAMQRRRQLAVTARGEALEPCRERHEARLDADHELAEKAEKPEYPVSEDQPQRRVRLRKPGERQAQAGGDRETGERRERVEHGPVGSRALARGGAAVAQHESDAREEEP